MTDPKFATMQAAYDARGRAGPREGPGGCGGTMLIATSYVKSNDVAVSLNPITIRCPGCSDCQPCTCRGEETCPRHTPPDAPEPKEEQ